MDNFNRPLFNRPKTIKMETKKLQNLIDAIADILIMAFLLASLYKLDVEKLLLKALKESKKRIEKLKKFVKSK